MSEDSVTTKLARLVLYAALVAVPGALGFILLIFVDPGYSIVPGLERWKLDELLGAFAFALCGIYALVHIQSKRVNREREKVAEILRGVADALVAHFPSGRIIDVNHYACELFGYTAEELVETSILDLSSYIEPSERERLWSELTAGDYATLGTTIIRADGSSVPVEVRLNLIEINGRRVILSLLRDVSARVYMVSELEKSENRKQAILEAIPDLIFRISGDGTYLEAEEKNCTISTSASDFAGANVRDVLPYEVAEEVMEKISSALATGETIVYKQALDTGDGTERCFDVRVVPSGSDEVIYLAREITDQVEMVRALEQSEARNRAIMEVIPDVVYRIDSDGTFLDVHTSESGWIRVPGNDLVGRRLQETAQTPEVALLYTDAIRRTLETGEKQTFSYTVSDEDRDMHREARMVPGGSGEVICFVSDINDRKQMESRIRQLAYRDTLTGLSNRYGFMERLEKVSANRKPGKTAVLLINMKEFARTNNSLGRDLGDSILRAIADHVCKNFGEDNSARLEGDEFAAVMEGIEDREEIETIVGNGLEYYESRPLSFAEMDFYLRARVGIAFMEPSDTPNDVLRKASIALMEAKRVRESNLKVFDQTMKQRALWRLHLERDLRRAIEDSELEVHYQPEVFLGSGKIYSLEALARWEHPKFGTITPSEFIPLAEETGLILDLGDYVLRKACRQLSFWRRSLPRNAPCMVSVNVSALQLRQRDFVGRIADLMRENDLPEGSLQLEITESAAITDIDESIRAFGQLRSLGVSLALDDFGTGHSSLAYLRRLPIDALKMDRSFNFQLDEDPTMSRIIAAVVELAHALEMQVISEGIETAEQLALLRNLDCDVGQGYYFARPLPPEDTLELLRSWRTLNLIRSSG